MEPSLIHKILIYLYRNDAINQRQLNITAFLKHIRDENDDHTNNFNRVVMALDRIAETGYASYNCSPLHHKLNQNVGETFCTLDNTEVNMDINLDGWNFIKNFIRENEQHTSALATNKSILATNSSILATNDSVKTLNELLPGFYRRQLRLTRITIWIAVVSFLSVGISAYYTSKSITASQFDATNAILQQNVRVLDSIRLYQQDIDRSLQKVIKDSIYQHKTTTPSTPK